jgi:hypothetical protein
LDNELSRWIKDTPASASYDDGVLAEKPEMEDWTT